MSQCTPLSIYLVKKSSVPPLLDLLHDKCTAHRELKSPLAGDLFALKKDPKQPSWVSAIASLVDGAGIDLQAQTPAALLFVKRNGRSFAITFGHAWMLLKDEWLDLDFGRKVALNCLSKESITELRTEQVFSRWHISSERAPKASSVTRFGVEFDRDRVAVVEGACSVAALGSIIRGGTSLKINIPIFLIGESLDKINGRINYRYRKEWPEIDNLVPVVSQAELRKLECSLDTALKDSVSRKDISLVMPAPKREQQFFPAGFYIGRRRESAALSPVLSYEVWEDYLRKKGISPSVDSARSSKLHLADEGGVFVSDSTVYQSFCFESKGEDGSYILSSGIWYKAEHNFIESINRKIGDIPSASFPLSGWHGTREDEYNKSASVSHGLVHMDERFVYYGGAYQKFEYCDLMDLDKKILYFVKIPGRSSDMSHFTEQVRRTLELFFGPDQGYRAELMKTLSKHYPEMDLSVFSARPSNRDFEVCMVSLGKEKKDLPFFAKCGLARLAKETDSKGICLTFHSVFAS